MQSSFKVSLPMKPLYFIKHRDAVAQVHARKGHLYHRLLRNIIRLCVFNAIFIGGGKNPEYQKDQGLTSTDYITCSKKVFSLQIFFSTVFPHFLITFLFQSKYLKEANLRYRISSYGAKNKLPFYFSPFAFITQF